MVSARVLIAVPVETLPRLVLAMRLVAWLRAASPATAAALFAEVLAGFAVRVAPLAIADALVPATALLAWVPLTAPAVLTQISLSISGLCQKRGASSMTT